MGSSIPCCQENDKKKPPSIRVPTSRQRTEKLSNFTIKSAKSENNCVGSPSSSIRAQLERSPKKDKNGRSPENYQSIKVLGKGSFGYVVLVQEKLTGRRFAMKMIPKSKINESNLLQTKVIPSIRKHPFLTHIYETFQNNENIYIVMQYLPKGDLYFYSHKQGTNLPEMLIRDILTQIIVGIEYLHKQGIVYRQLKPENLLVTDEGHIKLTDYGLSKLILEDAMQRGISTFIGAIEYMAPEAINGNFDQKADIWALGMVAYELKFKQNPLEHDGHKNANLSDYEDMLSNNYLNQKINSKIGYMSHEFRQLLLRLLDKNPMNRISLTELRRHPFFANISWQQVEERNNVGPLYDVIKKNDYIKFRDPTSEESRRRQIFKRHPGGLPKQKFSINLFEVRISQ